LLGLPFVQQACGPDAYDCYGLLAEMFKRANKPVLRLTTGLSLAQNVVIVQHQKLDNWHEVERQPNVAVVFRLGRVSCHVGFMLDEKRFIHAWRKTGVCVEQLRNWERRLDGYFDING